LKNTILIDFDGVIRHWSNSETIDLHNGFQLESNALFACAFSEKNLKPAITGEITHQQWCEQVRLELAEKYGDEIAAKVVNTWYTMASEIDYEFIRQIRCMAVKSRLILVTNATTRLESDLTEAGLNNAFDLVINSSDLGVAKPDVAYFRSALELLAVDSGECLFIDDSATNVEAARSFGIESVLHQTSEVTLQRIAKTCG